ncbi:hypothetical protein [Roseomonas indoligenes]|uniref:Uncharacterized protein n=1 Tax=Roseomonas indoligenes TaxID=2820811 RepID=A0A940S7Y8_9PROT|nr:hypothetical protein [Pararoseomonas indoligenes]MBP0495539.1 hypothetical protein [Pararoseomonas indoligenes]
MGRHWGVAGHGLVRPGLAAVLMLAAGMMPARAETPPLRKPVASTGQAAPTDDAVLELLRSRGAPSGRSAAATRGMARPVQQAPLDDQQRR